MFAAPPAMTAKSVNTAQGQRSSRKRKQISYAYGEESDEQRDRENATPLKKIKTSRSHLDSGQNAINKKPSKSPNKKRKDEASSNDEEKRLRRYRPKAPRSYLEIKERALTQRLTVLSRERCGTADVTEEKIVMAGSTGNVYTQHIGHIPRCDCPHAQKGNQCKHIIYVMLRVLKAPEHIAYQLALTTSELHEVFKNAAPIPSAAELTANDQAAAEDGNRKPIEGECPICYTEFEPGKEEIVYCKAACGNNVHKECMQSWVTARQGKATCPYCRAEWEKEDVGFTGKLDLSGAVKSEDGYVNVAAQLGLSGVRDYSTYHQPWMRQRFGYGRGGYASRSRYGRSWR